MSDIEYEKYLRVWKAYGIGSGKKIKISSLDTSKDARIPTLSTNVDEEVSDKLSSARSRAKPIPKAKSSTADDKNEDDSQDSVSAQLFSCTEEGCVKSYQRFSSLQQHLDWGKHERSLEHETILDKAIHGYAVRLEEQFTSAQVQQQPKGSMTLRDSPAMPWDGRLSHPPKKTDFLISKNNT